MIFSRLFKRSFVFFLLVSFFTIPVDNAFCEIIDHSVEKQIIMVYMTGSDLETSSGAATNDISEMLRSRYNTDELSVLVMIGGSKKWKSFPSDQTHIYEITGNRPSSVYSSELLNMGDSDSLSFFLQFCHDNYRASTYSLILWDHGGGPLEGVCFDENYTLPSGKDSLSLEELEKALATSPFSENNKLEWIGFDACLMSSIEVAYKCAPYAKYMIASQEVEPGSGWNYNFLKNIDHNSSGMETGKQIIDSYTTITTSKSNSTSPILTMSCTDLSKVDRIRELMDIVFGDISRELDVNTYSELVRKRLQAISIGRNSIDAANYDLVDLLGLIIAYDEDSPSSRELQHLIQESITYNSSNMEGLNGLSIYFPYYNKSYYQSSWNEKYKSLSISEMYSSFLEKYCNIWLAPSDTDWTNKMVHISANENETILSTELTDAQIRDFSSASLYILLDTGWNYITENNGFIFVDKNTNVQLIGNVLSAKDPGTVLVFCDSKDHVLANAVEYDIVDNEYIIPIKLSNMTTTQALQNIAAGVEEERTMTKAIMKCLPPDQSGRLQITSITIASDNDETISQGKMDIQLRDYAELGLVQNDHHMKFDQNGLLLPYEQWDQYGLSGYLLDLAEIDYEITVKVIDRKDVKSEDELFFDDYVYLFSITDTKNNRYSTEIKSFNH